MYTVKQTKKHGLEIYQVLKLVHIQSTARFKLEVVETHLSQEYAQTRALKLATK